jgi:hypothetical protein
MLEPCRFVPTRQKAFAETIEPPVMDLAEL